MVCFIVLHWTPHVSLQEDWAGIWNAILVEWVGPLPPALVPECHGRPTEASASTAHSMDLSLRQMLAGTVAKIKGREAKAQAAQELNVKRKHLLTR